MRPNGLQLVLRWKEPEAIFWFEADAANCGVIDELDVAILKSLDVCDWPASTAEGYTDYVP